MKKLFIACLGAILMLTTSCGKEELVRAEEAEQLSDVVINLNEDADPVSISLEADLDSEIEELSLDPTESDDDLRSLKFQYKNNVAGWDGVLDEKNLYSLCVIAPDKGMTAANTYYCKLTWTKVKGKNSFTMKQVNLTDVDNRPVNLKQKLPTGATKWRICGLLTYTASNVVTTASAKTVRFDPNATFATAVTGNEKVIKDIPLHFPWTDLTIEKGGEHASAKANKALRFKPMGSLVRVTLRNESAFKMRIKSLLIHTNGFVSTEGLAGWQTGLGVNASNVAVENAYSATAGTNGGKEEKAYRLSGNIDIEPGATYPKSFLLWVFPVHLGDNPATDRKYTKVYAEAVRLDGSQEKRYPEMKNLYGYWSTTNNLQKGKRYHMGVKLYRPKTALEYLSPDYVNQAKSGFGTPAFYGDRLQATAVNISGYEQLAAYDVYALYGKLSTATSHSSNDIKFGGQTTLKTSSNLSYKIGSTITNGYTDTFKNGSNIIYALRFDDGATKRRQYTAWRYMRGNPGSVQCVYLGPNFKGTFDDIAADAFWNFHRNDIVSRSYAKSSIFFNGSKLQSEQRTGNMLATHLKQGVSNSNILLLDEEGVGNLWTIEERKDKVIGNPNTRRRISAMIMKQTHDNFPNDNR